VQYVQKSLLFLQFAGPFGPNPKNLRNVHGALYLKASVPYFKIADSSYKYFAQDEKLLELDETFEGHQLFAFLHHFSTFEEGQFDTL
jgi:hypothetical protein